MSRVDQQDDPQRWASGPERPHRLGQFQLGVWLGDDDDLSFRGKIRPGRRECRRAVNHAVAMFCQDLRQALFLEDSAAL